MSETLTSAVKAFHYRARTISTLVPLFFLAMLLCGSAQAQDLSASDAPRKVKQYVTYAAEQQIVTAGKPSALQLHFRVDPGYHINSHTPKSELLLPTLVELVDVQASALLKTLPVQYPPGKPYSFPADPAEKLDVYAEDFVVRVPVVAGAGPHELKGLLRYQACDNAACYPPKSLPITILFTAK